MRETLHEVAAAVILAILGYVWKRFVNYRRDSKRTAEENRHRLDVLWRESGFKEWDGVERRENDRRAHPIDYSGPERRKHQRRR